MLHKAGVEPATFYSQNKRSNQLSYLREVTLSIAIIFFADPEESNLVLFTMFSNGY